MTRYLSSLGTMYFTRFAFENGSERMLSGTGRFWWERGVESMGYHAENKLKEKDIRVSLAGFECLNLRQRVLSMKEKSYINLKAFHNLSNWAFLRLFSKSQGKGQVEVFIPPELHLQLPLLGPCPPSEIHPNE